MPRILHIIDSLGRTGLSKQLLLLSQGLVRHGFDVHVAALGGRGSLVAEFRAAGVTVKELNRRSSCDPIALLRLRRLIGWLRPEVIHTWNFDAGVYGRLVASASTGTRVVAGHYGVDRWKGRAAWGVDRRLARRTSRFVTNSPLIRDWSVRHGSPPARFIVIPFGVPPAPRSDVTRDALLRELQLPADARLIGVVGRLAPEKRVKDLIWAADLLRVLHDNLRLLVIGGGPLRPELEHYASLASDLDHIRFLGERADVWRIMPHLDVLWNADEPRRQAVAILEAMSAGVPVVAGDTPLHRELIVENETGYLVPLYERAGRAARARHTDRLFTESGLAVRLAASSRQRIENQRSAERMVQGHIDAYAQAVG